MTIKLEDSLEDSLMGEAMPTGGNYPKSILLVLVAFVYVRTLARIILLVSVWHARNSEAAASHASWSSSQAMEHQCTCSTAAADRARLGWADPAGAAAIGSVEFGLLSSHTVLMPFNADAGREGRV